MFVAVLFLQLGMVANAQEQKGMPARPQFNQASMDSMQCHRMVDELLLDDATTAKFAPAYMNYLSETRSLFPQPKFGAKDGKEKPQMKDKTDAEVQKMLEEHFSNEQKMLDIRTKYYKEFKRYLSPKQLVRVFGPQGGFGHGGPQFGGMAPGNEGCPMMGQDRGHKFGKSSFGKQAPKKGEQMSTDGKQSN